MDSSAYAAPNTPIASSKRPRMSSSTKENSKRDVKSPSPVLKNHNAKVNNMGSPTTTPSNRKSNFVQSKHNASQQTAQISNSSHTYHHQHHQAETPSKIMFSPYLRKSNDELNENNHHNHIDSMNTSGSSDDKTHIDDSHHTTTMDDEESQEDENVFNPYQFMAFLPDHASVMIKGKICLPPPSPTLIRPTLVLDLDETLVHCTVEPIPKPDLIFPVSFNGSVYQVYVRKRPYLDYFLETVSKSYEVVVFTASQQVYADVLLDHLDPQRQHVSYRLFREACLFVQGNYLKDLAVINRDMRKTILVDNSPHAYGYQIDNGIPIESWYDDENDTELLKLIGFLRRLHEANDDVRPIVREHFKTYQLIANAKLGLPMTNFSAPPF
eukprot:gene4847-6794_t